MEEKLAMLNQKLEADKSLAEKIFNLETAAEVQSLLKTQGLEFSLEEINSLKGALVKSAQKSELSEEELEEVAGGIIVTTSVAATTFAVLGGTSSAAGLVHTITRSRW